MNPQLNWIVRDRAGCRGYTKIAPTEEYIEDDTLRGCEIEQKVVTVIVFSPSLLVYPSGHLITGRKKPLRKYV